MFVYKKWEELCKKLKEKGYISQKASSVKKNDISNFLILKHDVEVKPFKALKMAEIENKYFHKGSYYFQAYLLKDKKNINLIKEIENLGHEVSYHHDVMDSNNGNIEDAKKDFKKNLSLFKKYNFNVETVCQHGNPVLKRDGYNSNRDFFRDYHVKMEFADILDIMVNFKDNLNIDYDYISDSGYSWKVIDNPEKNDIINSSDNNISLENLDKVFDHIISNNNVILSVHPHRWSSNFLRSKLRLYFFKILKLMAKSLKKIPFLNKIMSKFYFLAKKI